MINRSLQADACRNQNIQPEDVIGCWPRWVDLQVWYWWRDNIQQPLWSPPTPTGTCILRLTGSGRPRPQLWTPEHKTPPPAPCALHHPASTLPFTFCSSLWSTVLIYTHTSMLSHIFDLFPEHQDRTVCHLGLFSVCTCAFNQTSVHSLLLFISLLILLCRLVGHFTKCQET